MLIHLRAPFFQRLDALDVVTLNLLGGIDYKHLRSRLTQNVLTSAFCYLRFSFHALQSNDVVMCPNILVNSVFHC
jgi:hypothetical protein